jgi:S1-C subfamily serine protease
MKRSADSANGRAVHSLGEFVMAVGKHKAGEKVMLVVRLGESETTMEITLGEWPE